MSAKKGGGYVRVKAETQTAIKIVAGRIQAETGSNVSANDAIWSIIKEYLPDIAEKAMESVSESNSDEKEDTA